MKKIIKDMNYKELTEFLKENKKINEKQFKQVRLHKNVENVTFYKRAGNVADYIVDINKDNGNIYEYDIEILVQEGGK